MAEQIQGRYLYAGYVILPLEISGLPPTITIHGEILRHQPEFHISLLGVKHLAPAIAKEEGLTTEEVIAQLLRAFTDFTRQHEIGLTAFMDEFRYVTCDDRAAVFVRCQVKNLEELFAYLQHVTGYRLQVPPAHVTLYARPGKGIRGVGVISAEQLAQTEVVGKDIPDQVRHALKL